MQQLFLGPGSLEQLEPILVSSGTNKLLAVVDQTAFRHSGAQDKIGNLLKRSGALLFSDFAPNPKIEDVLQGIELYRRCVPSIVLSLGGGTAIDIAKLISSLARSDRPRDVALGKLPVSAKQSTLVSIPTTAGTGSESTQFAVVYVDGHKFSLDHPSLLPDVAIVDSDLMQTLPPAVTAATGLDALCQAVESLWSVSANDASIDLAREAIELALEHLIPATLAPKPIHRESMCRAANLAGRAINVTRTTACHALSYAMTSNHGLPHGIAVALTLAPMLRFNWLVSNDDCTDPRGAQAVRDRIMLILKAMKVETVESACLKIEHLLQQIGCPVTLAEAGIDSSSDIEKIIQSVNIQRMSNNPRRTSPDALRALLI